MTSHSEPGGLAASTGHRETFARRGGQAFLMGGVPFLTKATASIAEWPGALHWKSVLATLIHPPPS